MQIEVFIPVLESSCQLKKSIVWNNHQPILYVESVLRTSLEVTDWRAEGERGQWIGSIKCPHQENGTTEV